MDEAHHNPGLAEEVIGEKDLNIDWINEESVEGGDEDKAKVRSDDEVVGHMFGS